MLLCIVPLAIATSRTELAPPLGHLHCCSLQLDPRLRKDVRRPLILRAVLVMM